MSSYRDAGIEDYLRPSELIGLDWIRVSVAGPDIVGRQHNSTQRASTDAGGKHLTVRNYLCNTSLHNEIQNCISHISYTDLSL